MAKTRTIQFVYVTTGLCQLTFCFRTATNRISFFQILLVLFTFFLISLLSLTEINIVRWKQSMILYFSSQLCHFKHYRCRCRCRSRWENLDRGQCSFQPIKFMNLVVPSPCETEPYNKCTYWYIFAMNMYLYEYEKKEHKRGNN